MNARKIRNMEEFASAAGISRPTISKYFNDPSSVRSSTRERIEAALERFDYRPNIYAINQNRRLTKNIGIVVPYLSDPFFAEIARRTEQRCIDAGFRPILLGSHGSARQEAENLESLVSLKPAGVLLAPLGRVSDRTVIEKFCDQVPTVLFDCNIDQMGKAFVGMDNMQSIGLIVDYLCRTGEPPTFFEMKSPPNPNANARRAAYLEKMDRLGHTPDILQADGDGWNFEEIGYQAGTRALAQNAFSTNTVLCSNDRLAIGMLTAAYERGLRVGHGDGYALRVAGHDDHPYARFTCPPLTTVAQDYEAIAATSIEILLGVIESENGMQERRTVLFDGKLVMRASA